MNPQSHPEARRLFEALRSGTESRQVRALEALSEESRAEDLAELRKLLVEALEEARPPKTEEDRHPQAMKRRWLVEALGRIEDDDATAAAVVRAHLKPQHEPNRWVRYAALAGLFFSRPADLERIARNTRRQDKQPWPHSLAVAILAWFGDAEAMRELKENLGEGGLQVSSLRALRTVYIEELTDQVIDVVRNTEFSVPSVYDAIVALGCVPPDSPRRESAAEVLLYALKQCRSQPWLVGHKTQTVRSLGNLSLPTTASLLLPELTDDDPGIVKETSLALEKMLGTSGALSLVVAEAARQSSTPVEQFTRALRWLGDQGAISPALEQIANSGPASHRRAATRLLRAYASSGGLRTSAPQALLRAFREDHPEYDQNVFVMMPFREIPELQEIWNSIEVNLREHGFRALRADSRTYGQARQLWDNLITYMHGCKYGIAVLEDISAEEFNPNVALEYGFMRALGKQVLLLKEQQFAGLRADILGSVWIEFDIDDIQTSIREAIDRWLDDIR